MFFIIHLLFLSVLIYPSHKAQDHWANDIIFILLFMILHSAIQYVIGLPAAVRIDTSHKWKSIIIAVACLSKFISRTTYKQVFDSHLKTYKFKKTYFIANLVWWFQISLVGNIAEQDVLLTLQLIFWRASHSFSAVSCDAYGNTSGHCFPCWMA